MITLLDVTAGRVNLAEIAEINHYLDMKADIEEHAVEESRKEAAHGKRSR